MACYFVKWTIKGQLEQGNACIETDKVIRSNEDFLFIRQKLAEGHSSTIENMFIDTITRLD